jgi:hypothetical protein
MHSTSHRKSNAGRRRSRSRTHGKGGVVCAYKEDREQPEVIERRKANDYRT